MRKIVSKSVFLFVIYFLFIFLSNPNILLADSIDIEKIFYISESKNGIESFRKNVSVIDVIAPQSYTLTNNLGISGNVNSEIKKIAIDNKVKIIPLIVNQNFSQTVIHKLLTSTQDIQDRVIDFMLSEAKINNFAGWQLDFEHISYLDRDLYSQFVERASKKFKLNNLSLSIAAVSRINDQQTDFYRNWSGAFDYERLSRSLDFISVMTYDDPDSKGPSASMPFVENVYSYLKDKIPKEKFSLGIPLYYWSWREVPFIRLRSGGTYERLRYIRAQYDTSEGFDEILKIPYLKYSVGKDSYIVWHEDSRSFGQRIEFIRKNSLRGFSAWVLGVENPGIWKKLKNNLSNESGQVVKDEIQLKIENMTLEQKIAQLFMVGLYSDDSNAQLEMLIKENKIGSIILLNQNINGKNIYDVTKHFQDVASSSNQPLLLIAVDQEGGTVSRIKEPQSNLTPQSQINTSGQAYKVAFDRGKELRSKGINVNFAPILEYITKPKSFLYARVFRGSKDDIISFGENMVRGYQESGIATAVKHFPGHDDESVDSHKYLPVSQIKNIDYSEFIRTFTEVIKRQKPDMVMTSHVLYPSIDPLYPATLSQKYISDLRQNYGYDGIVITDDMNMGAISKKYKLDDSVIRAINSGNDILLFAAPIKTVNKAYSVLLNAVRDGELEESKIDSNIRRVLNLKEKIASKNKEIY